MFARMMDIIPHPRSGLLAVRRFENGRRRMLQAVDEAVELAQQVMAAYPQIADHEAFETAAKLTSDLLDCRTYVVALQIGDGHEVVARITARLTSLLEDAGRRLPTLLRQLAHRQTAPE